MAAKREGLGTGPVITCVTGRAPRVLLHETFEASGDQVAVARRAVDKALTGEVFDADLVLLLVSELAGNAIRHSRSESFTLVLARMPSGQLRITVIDDGRGASTPHLRQREVTDTGGRGLWLVDRLAARWGVTRERTRRVAVWLDIDQDATCWSHAMPIDW